MLMRRLAWHYIKQWVFVAVVLIAGVFATILWTTEHMLKLDVNRQFAANGLQYVTSALFLDEQEKIGWEPNLEQEIAESGGWLQILDDAGQELHAFSIPSDVPKRYNAGELISYMNRSAEFPYRILVYVTLIDSKEVTLVYGEKNTAAELLDLWAKDRTAAQEELLKHQAWVVQLDADGQVIYEWNVPKGVEEGEDKISPSDLALRVMYEERYKEHIAYRYDVDSGTTWVLRFPFEAKEAAVYMAGLRATNETDLLLIGSGTLLVGVVILFMLMALWQSTRVSKPLTHFVEWSGDMASGYYREPVLNSRPRSVRRNGKLRSNYRLFSEVWSSLRALSVQLREAEEERKLHEKQREEWLSGLTHDLKTPLASVIGYAHLLTAKQYEWSEQEKQEFADMICQKAERMDELIQDINLTYQLNSHSLPLQRVKTEMNEWLQEAVKDVIPPGGERREEVIFRPAPQPVWLEIDARYFLRAVENVCMNAWIHNPPRTGLTVSLEQVNADIKIRFKDDGDGIDEELLRHLFTRYYRGTSTDVSERGSGLGMTITKQLIEAHHGSVMVHTEKGKGTEIIFHFKCEW